MTEGPENEQLFVLVDASVRTGRRGGGRLESEECRVLGANGRNTLNDNGEQLLSFSANHRLALFNTFFSTENATLQTFNGRGKKRIKTILTRQWDRKLAGRYCKPPTVLSTYFGSQHRPRTCETA